jgi:hypothetical protein
MKKVFFIVAITAFASSCKKDKTTAEGTTSFEKNLVTVTIPGQSEWNMFYANDHKLLSFSNNEMTVSYKPGVPFSAKKTAAGIVHEYQNAVQDVQGRILKLDRYNSGALIAKQEFKYNAEGYLLEHTMKANSLNYFVKYVYEYQAGNLTTVSAYEGAVKTGTFLFEYYTNQYNPIQIDLFDFKGIQFITDTQFGKQSKNLVKSAKLLTGDGQTFASIDLNYTTDTDGYIKTITQSSGFQSPMVYTCTFQ